MENNTEKKLYKSKNNRTISGVCGGLGEYFNIDPTLVRLACVALCIFAGGGLLAYIVALIIIPEAPEGYDPQAANSNTTAGNAEAKAEPSKPAEDTDPSNDNSNSNSNSNSNDNTPTLI